MRWNLPRQEIWATVVDRKKRRRIRTEQKMTTALSATKGSGMSPASSKKLGLMRLRFQGVELCHKRLEGQEREKSPH